MRRASVEEYEGPIELLREGSPVADMQGSLQATRSEELDSWGGVVWPNTPIPITGLEGEYELRTPDGGIGRVAEIVPVLTQIDGRVSQTFHVVGTGPPPF